MIKWISEGDTDYGVCEAGQRLYASIQRRGGARYELRLMLPGWEKRIWGASRKATLIRWSERYFNAHRAWVEASLPAKIDPLGLPPGQEEWFYDAIWEGYRPTKSKQRY